MNFQLLNVTATRIIRSSNKATIIQSPRLLTTACSDALNKFRGAVEDYRVEHYKQELPSRCKKEVLKAATRGRNDSVITIDAIEKLLINIGAEDKVSRKDVEIILSEVGESESNSGAIHIDQMMRVL
mmetsp:Transcript_11553/g.13609  ORF Transcript_11553/g.13609 Transcript_11553/m.13609 type:complete len:127 (+) Transcript_11553:210-590(+)|eukprot:CAMPEP_0198273614 /NCGR_PEP_ID=MMETSP1447-20131203/57373_1 /TAXON_ID=420782 /ORGANISM="Chaetoceros dichaeta, Strain CCMP1751" /LENGTH=126 /DNA_ID=CAMNT_0043967367 /DNA_START=165 /DNA_END=545 /DNA_ORIENTATION=-